MPTTIGIASLQDLFQTLERKREVKFGPPQPLEGALLEEHQRHAQVIDALMPDIMNLLHDARLVKARRQVIIGKLEQENLTWKKNTMDLMPDVNREAEVRFDPEHGTYRVQVTDNKPRPPDWVAKVLEELHEDDSDGDIPDDPPGS